MELAQTPVARVVGRIKSGLIIFSSVFVWIAAEPIKEARAALGSVVGLDILKRVSVISGNSFIGGGVSAIPGEKRESRYINFIILLKINKKKCENWAFEFKL